VAQDAVALIKADHRKVEQLFREFEDAGDRAYKTKQQLVAEIIRELEVHATRPSRPRPRRTARS
jgi:hypothetical protein